jgi:hypothetical protein
MPVFVISSQWQHDYSSQYHDSDEKNIPEKVFPDVKKNVPFRLMVVRKRNILSLLGIFDYCSLLQN